MPILRKQAYGYMHTVEGNTKMVEGKDAIVDFTKEKSYPFSKKNTDLTYIPHGNNDNFTVSGLGISGVFRLHHNGPIQFLDQNISTKSEFKDTWGLNGSIHVGGDWGAGAGLSLNS